MLGVSGAALVLWLHILAASVWIGGQVAVAVLIPLLRGRDDLARVAGRRYQLVAWPAFLVLVVTGIFNVANAGISWSHLFDSSVGRTLAVKLGFVLLSGLAAAVHAFVQAPKHSDARAHSSAAASAILGSVSVLSAIVAALYGVVIAGA